jgi:hypothetical protein
VRTQRPKNTHTPYSAGCPGSPAPSTLASHPPAGGGSGQYARTGTGSRRG